MEPKFLIADSVSVMRDNLRNTLRDKNFTSIIEADNGEDACLMFAEEKPDIVIMDLSLNGKSGMESLRDMKKINPDAKIIICSASAHKELVIEAAKLGASDFILKPLKIERLIQTVTRLVNEL